MNKDSMDIKFPRVGTVVILLSALLGFFISIYLYEYLTGIIIPLVKGWFLIGLTKTVIMMSYYLLIIIGGLLSKSKHTFIRISGLLFAGFGAGVALRITLLFIGAISPF